MAEVGRRVVGRPSISDADLSRSLLGDVQPGEVRLGP